MTPEEQVLSLLDFLKERSTDNTPIKSTPSLEAEWTKWLACAGVQAVAPLLYFRIKENELETNVPDYILAQLQSTYHQNAARNLLFLHETKNVVEKLSSHNIPIILLKGGFLSHAVYENPALRIMSDIDILIPLPNIQTSLEILYNIGYYRVYPPWEETAYNVTLALQESPVLLEVHWELSSIANDPALPTSDIWKSTIQRPYMGVEFSSMEPINLLIHLCHHAAIMHLYALGIRALCDIDAVTRRYTNELDWKIIVSRAESWGLQRAVSLTLRLCWQYLETPLPEIAIELLKLRQIDQEIVNETISQISFAKDEPNNLLNPDITRFLKRILSEKTPNKMFAFLLKSIHRPVRPPSINAPALTRQYFYFRRFIYLIKKYLGATSKYLRQSHGATLQINRQKELLKWLRG